MTSTLKARTSNSDTTCVDIGSNDAFCRNSTTGIKEAGFKKSNSDAECVTDNTKCKDSDNIGVLITLTLKERSSNSDTTCVDTESND